jgi:hypothetical protein
LSAIGFTILSKGIHSYLSKCLQKYIKLRGSQIIAVFN